MVYPLATCSHSLADQPPPLDAGHGVARPLGAQGERRLSAGRGAVIGRQSLVGGHHQVKRRELLGVADAVRAVVLSNKKDFFIAIITQGKQKL
jgi:hypothetical protein